MRLWSHKNVTHIKCLKCPRADCVIQFVDEIISICACNIDDMNLFTDKIANGIKSWGFLIGKFWIGDCGIFMQINYDFSVGWPYCEFFFVDFVEKLRN